MKTFITGDTHSDFKRFSFKNWPLGKTLTKEDVCIICGDFGGLWLNTPDKDETYWLNWLNDCPWTTVFCDGNHCNFTRLNNLPRIEKFNGIVGKAHDSIFHLRRGQIYTINENTFFVMGGAKSIDKHHRTEWISWWAEEEPNYQELSEGLNNLDKVGNKVDYIIGHTCPISVLKRLGEICRVSYGDKLENLNKYFEELIQFVSFDRFFFGHFHEDENIGGRFYALYKDIIQIK